MPKGAIDQLGHALDGIIYAFAESADDKTFFLAKYDIKDGFWRLDCAEGEEWNFSYVLPQEEGKPVMLVVPTSLQMGWVVSPPYFCAASGMARDVATEYAATPVGTIRDHKFTHFALTDPVVQALPESVDDDNDFKYFIDVYVNDFIPMVIVRSMRQIEQWQKLCCKGFMMFSQLMRKMKMTLLPYRSSTKEAVLSPLRRVVWALTLMGT